METIWHLFLHFTGSDDTSSVYYGFWSGFGSDLGEITLIAGLVAWWRAGECHVDSCHRRGKYPFKHYKLCRVHHPDMPDKVTRLHIMKANKALKEK